MTKIKLGSAELVLEDCFEWLGKAQENSIHAVVTDPPYGVKEYELDQIQKRDSGKGGVWRIPPSFDGANRSPLPRFTALNVKEREKLRLYFTEWSRLITRVLRPGGHVFIASNSFLSNMMYSAVVEGGLEFRGEMIRLVRTLRGGDKPKNAESEFPGVCSMPRGCYEPWGIFRKSLPSGMTVADCLREFQTGGLRRYDDGRPFEDVIFSERTPKAEKLIADHPSLKPQTLMREIVRAALPLGAGTVLDPFMGSGSTLAAAIANGYKAIGLERNESYFNLAVESVPKLASVKVSAKNSFPIEVQETNLSASGKSNSETFSGIRLA